jgi:transcriptional regulator with XRE-family HTH domain
MIDSLPSVASAPRRNHNMEEAGQKLKRARERLNLRYRDVEEASNQIAARHNNDEFSIALSRLSDIENKGTVPTIYRLYSLCTIYRLDVNEVLDWYGVNVATLAADAASIQMQRTHLIGFGANGYGDAQMPLALDPGIDLRRTTFLSRMIQRWGKLPLTLLNSLDMKNYRYAFIGSEDWTMYPLIQPSSLVLIDDSHRKVVNTGWQNEFERPIYFFEHRKGFSCGWCTLNENQLVLQPHPSSMCYPEIFTYPADIDVVGQVVGVAMRLDQGKRRRNRT